MVVPNLTRRLRCVNSQLVCLTPFGIFKYFMFISVIVKRYWIAIEMALYKYYYYDDDGLIAAVEMSTAVLFRANSTLVIRPHSQLLPLESNQSLLGCTYMYSVKIE